MTKYIFTRDLPPTLHKKGDVVYDNEPIAYVQQLATWLALGYIEEEKKDEVKEEEFPMYSDFYYFIQDSGKVCDSIWFGHPVDADRKSLGNLYRTEVEALEAKARVERAYKGI